MKENTVFFRDFFLKKAAYWKYILFSLWLSYPIYKSINALNKKPNLLSFPLWGYYIFTIILAIFLIFGIHIIAHKSNKNDYWSGYSLFFISSFLSIFPLSLALLKINFAIGIFLIFILLLSNYHKNKGTIPLFYAGLLVGIISLIIPLGVLFFFLIFTILIINQDFYWKKWMAPIIGLVIPLIYLLSIFYLFGWGVPQFSFLPDYHINQEKTIWKDWAWIGFFSSFLILSYFLRLRKNHIYSMFESAPIICFQFIGVASLLLAVLLYWEIKEIFLFFGVSFSLLFSYYFDQKWIENKEKKRMLFSFIASGIILWIILHPV